MSTESLDCARSYALLAHICYLGVTLGVCVVHFTGIKLLIRQSKIFCAHARTHTNHIHEHSRVESKRNSLVLLCVKHCADCTGLRMGWVNCYRKGRSREKN